jgi:hypothetical protein
MDLMTYHRKRSAIQVTADPGSPQDLAAVEDAFRDLLIHSGLFEDVEVERTDNPDELVIAVCTFRPFYTERDVANRLEVIWSDRVRYPFWEAHALRTFDDHVELEAASRIGPEGHYVTVHIVAQRAGIPEQRVGL